MKLWSKGSANTEKKIEAFTVGRDREFDFLMAECDVQGSIAHVTMLGEVGMMSSDDAQRAIAGLRTILASIQKGTFTMDPESEDIHSQIEGMLTEQIGDAGKMIHTGRSRNDQVAVDIKLYLRSALTAIKTDVLSLFDLLIEKSNQHRSVLIPGYTHLQIAMPSSIGLWLGAYAESLVDDMQLLNCTYRIINKNPLGSGAGYGSSFPLNRTRTTELLGFDDLHYNSIYAQMSRGKSEKLCSLALASVAATLSKLSMDCCLYMNQNFGFIRFPDELTTGSSIMPHKKNPDVFELIRAKCNRIQSIPNELTLLMNNLPSGYHRDMQLTKEMVFPAFQELGACLEMMQLMLTSLQVNEAVLQDPRYAYLFSVEKVNELVNQGVPFRDAYVQVGKMIEAGQFSVDASKELIHTHEGSIGNLCNDEIRAAMQKAAEGFN
ncbi:MAG: argininosuccinate lyase [Bacteroidota bacterium]